MNTYIYAGKRNLEYEKNRHNKCCGACSPSDC